MEHTYVTVSTAITSSSTISGQHKIEHTYVEVSTATPVQIQSEENTRWNIPDVIVSTAITSASHVQSADNTRWNMDGGWGSRYRGLGIFTPTQTCASEVLKSSIEQL